MHLFSSYKKDGSLVVETSLIMPGIIAAIMFIIYAGFYYYDRCVIEEVAYSSVLKSGSGYVYDGDHINNDLSYYELERLTENKFVEATNNRLVGNWEIDSKALADEEEITLKIKGVMDMPGGFLMEYISEKLFSIDIVESSKNIYEPLYIRMK